MKAAVMTAVFGLMLAVPSPTGAHSSPSPRCDLFVVSPKGSITENSQTLILTHLDEPLQVHGDHFPPNAEATVVVVHDDGSERQIEPYPVSDGAGSFVIHIAFPAGEQVEAIWAWASTDIECHDGVGVQVLQRTLDADAAAAPTSSPAPVGALPDTAVAGGPASVLALLMSLVLILAVEKLRRSRLRGS